MRQPDMFPICYTMLHWNNKAAIEIKELKGAELLNACTDDMSTDTPQDIQRMIMGLEYFRDKFGIQQTTTRGRYMIKDFIIRDDGLIQNVTRMLLNNPREAHGNNRLVVRCNHIVDTISKQMKTLFGDTYIPVTVLPPNSIETLSMEQLVADAKINYPTIKKVVTVNYLHSQIEYELSLAIRITLTDQVATPKTMFGISDKVLKTDKYEYQIITGDIGHTVCNQVMARMFPGWGQTPYPNPHDWEQIEVKRGRRE